MAGNAATCLPKKIIEISFIFLKAAADTLTKEKMPCIGLCSAWASCSAPRWVSC
jgi:hypothetical protein